MLQNLVHNAMKHAPRNSAVKVEARMDGDGLILRVADDGPGVPARDAERIFDRFVTLDADPSRGSHGLEPGGLHLSLHHLLQ